MHFLSHYYTELPTSSPLFVAGLGIPDLTPSFTRIYNSKIRKLPEPANADLKEIQRGITRHYAGDKWFHGSALFNKQVSLICKAFVQVGINRSRLRLSVIAHLAVEMMVDRQIVLQNRAVCEDYYSLVMQADEEVLVSYFDRMGLVAEKSIFMAKFGFFKERKFLFLFENLERLVFGLGRVYASATGVEFTEEENAKFLTALYNIDSKMRYSWQPLLKP